MKNVKLSKIILEFFGLNEKEELELRKTLNERLGKICKPCWELKYCPYGPLVEDFPIPPITNKQYMDSMYYLQKCLERNAYGPKFDIPLDEYRRKLFKQDLEGDNMHTVEALSDFEEKASCLEFGHLCPAYFVSEDVTETAEIRKQSRNIDHATMIRVARRDNNICQICGKIVNDREIEFDHIIPFSRGGISSEHNLRVTCRECNRKKGNTNGIELKKKGI